MADTPKKLSPMMQKKLAAEAAAKASGAAPEAKTEAPAPAAEPAAPKAAPPKPAAAATAPKPVAAAVSKPVPAAAPKAAPSAQAKVESPFPTTPNPNGPRYGYGDGLASVFGTPPAIDEAYKAVKIVVGIPLALIETAKNVVKKVTG